MTRHRFLAGDIGGTTTRLQLVEYEDATTRVVAEQYFDSKRYAGLSDIVIGFCRNAGVDDVDAACFAVAGPVQRREDSVTIRVTNLPWEIDSSSLARETRIPRVRLMNDFEAVGYGIDQLDASETVVLQAGRPERQGPRAVLGAGTGLGQAILVWQQDHYTVISTEGGHVDFGPTDAEQIELVEWLIRKRGRASYEDILSGRGLVRLYEFVREHRDIPEAPGMAATMKQGDPAAAISRAALEQSDPLALAALKLFVTIYGAQAGNLALVAGATGGVYVAGGIAVKILEVMQGGEFLAAFRNKGRMTALLERIPLCIVTSTDVGLRGALSRAVHQSDRHGNSQ